MDQRIVWRSNSELRCVHVMHNVMGACDDDVDVVASASAGGQIDG